MVRGPWIGASPSGKAPDFDSGIRRFESFRPSHPASRLSAQRGICPLFFRPSQHINVIVKAEFELARVVHVPIDLVLTTCFENRDRLAFEAQRRGIFRGVLQSALEQHVRPIEFDGIAQDRDTPLALDL